MMIQRYLGRSYRLVASLAAIGLLLLATPALAAVSVGWSTPPDGSVFPVGTSVAPTGVASASGIALDAVDVVLVLDSSGSMTTLETAGGITQSRRQWQQDAAIQIVNRLPASAQVGIVEFDSDANLVTGLTALTSAANEQTLINAINGVDASGGTFIGSGIDMAITELNSASARQAQASQQIVVFSDGRTGGNPATNAADALLNGVENVHSVALPGADTLTMESIATAGSGVFVDATDDISTVADQIFSATPVGLDRVEVTLPDGTVVTVGVDAFGNFQTPGELIAAGPNTYIAEAFGTDGTVATDQLTLFGDDGGGGPTNPIPEPGAALLFGIGTLVVGLYRPTRGR